MKSFLPTKVLAEKLGIKLYHLRNNIQLYPSSYQKAVVTRYKTKRGKKGKSAHLCWGIDAHRLEDFKQWWFVDRFNHHHTRLVVEEGGTRWVWTRTARECFAAKFYCHKCPNYEECSRIEEYLGRKPIKKTVLKLYSVLGEPPRERIEDDNDSSL